jgi:hypothetical protein
MSLSRSASAVAAYIVLLVSLPAIADDSLAGIGELIMTEHAAEARTRLTSARDAFVTQGDRSGEASTELLLGLAEAALGDSTAAQPHFNKAVSTFVAIEEHFGAWLSLTTLAQFETQNGRPRDAIAMHERSLQLSMRRPIRNRDYRSRRSRSSASYSARRRNRFECSLLLRSSRER